MLGSQYQHQQKNSSVLIYLFKKKNNILKKHKKENVPKKIELFRIKLLATNAIVVRMIANIYLRIRIKIIKITKILCKLT